MELYEYELTQDEIKQLEDMRNAKKAGANKNPGTESRQFNPDNI